MKRIKFMTYLTVFAAILAIVLTATSKMPQWLAVVLMLAIVITALITMRRLYLIAQEIKAQLLKKTISVDK